MRFVVHQHHASKLHYDLRIELGGGLKDFVIPKGPSTDPLVRRLTIALQDHALSCLTKEGVIQPGLYGAGALIVWDTGLYRPGFSYDLHQEEAMWRGLDSGYLELEFFGEKLKGKWKLFRAGKDWLFQKVDDEYASSKDILLQNRSVISGRTIQDLRAKSILSIELLEFYIDRSRPNVPQVVYRNDEVLDVNRAALHRGVLRGQPFHQAKAILREAEFKVWEPEEYRNRELEWLNLCIEYSNIVEPQDQHVAFVDMSSHPDPVDVAEALVRTLSQATKLNIRTGMASAKWIARLAALRNDCGDAQRNPKKFLSSLPLSDLLPVETESRQRLMFLGYATIGDVASIPFPILKDQFDDLSFLIHSSANGTLSDEVKPSYPPQSCSARLIFDGATDSHLVVENAVEVLAEKLGSQLDLQNLEGTVLIATLEYEDTTTIKLERTFSKPMRNADTLLPSIHLLIEKSLEKPLSAIVILMTDLRKVNVAQSIFLDRPDRRTPPRLETTLHRVKSVFGDNSVKLGQEIKIPRRLHVLREWKHVTGWW